MAVQAVVFDYGKVISLPPEGSALAELAALAGLEASVMDRLMGQYRESYDRGELDGPGYYRALTAQAGLSLEDAVIRKMTRLDLDSWAAVNLDTLRLMEDVKAAGLKLGILSNMPRDFLDRARKESPLFSLPDAGVFSCEIAAVKPEAAIYRVLIAALGCAPGDIVFFDDVQANVEGALAQGIRGYLWEDPPAAREILWGLKALEGRV